MTGAEALQLFVIIVALGCGYWWLWNWNDRALKKVHVPMSSAHYQVAYTGSTCLHSFDPWVAKGATVFIPASDGCYSQRVKRNRGYKEGLERWIDELQTTIHIIITRPTEDSRREWQSFKDRYPDRMKIYFLHREAVAADKPYIKSQIEKLDTFHPVLLINPQGSRGFPGAMYIESHHPIDSKYAYDVEFLNPADTAKDERFPKYKEMYEGLLQGPHVELLEPSQRAKQKQSQQREPIAA